MNAFLYATRTINGVPCGIFKFLFTWGLCVGIDQEGCEKRYCYEHATDAEAALMSWDGQGHPPGPWIKCKGRDGADLLNPELTE